MNGTDVLVREILDSIKCQYILGDVKIPAEVLKLKDEAMEIFVKSQQESSPDILRQYEQRLAEIYKNVAPRKGETDL